MPNRPVVSFPFDVLEGDPNNAEDGRLTGSITIAGARFWCEALPVKNDAEGMQEGCDDISESRRMAILDEFDANDVQTVSITRGGVARDYVLIIIPGDR